MSCSHTNHTQVLFDTRLFKVNPLLFQFHFHCLCGFSSSKMSQTRELYQQPHILRKRKNNIPDDIILNILARIPVKSVTRFKCVVKTWDSSITTSNFVSTHLNNKNNCKVMIYNYISCWLYSMTKSVVIALILFLVFCEILLYWV